MDGHVHICVLCGFFSSDTLMMDECVCKQVIEVYMLS